MVRSEADRGPVTTTQPPDDKHIRLPSNIRDDRLPSLDGMRALCVIVVLMCHATDERVDPAIRALFPYFNGISAVRVFFVISGFLITTLLIQERERTNRISIVRFYQRRFVRLFPVQCTYVLFLLLLTITTPLQISPCRLATALLYVKNYGCAGEIEGHLWSLSVEEQFYLLWPLALAFLTWRWCYIVAFVFIFLSPFSRIYEYRFEFPGTSNPFWIWLTSNADVILIGCIAALIYEKEPVRRLINFRPAIGRMGAIVMLAAPPILTNYLLFGFLTVTIGPTIQAIGAAYLVISCIVVRRGLLFGVLNLPLLTFIGIMSYSLYVWQQIFFFATPKDFGLRDSIIFHFPIDLLAAVGAGCLSYFVLELPLAGVRKAMARRAFRPAATGESRPDGNSSRAAERGGVSSLAGPVCTNDVPSA